MFRSVAAAALRGQRLRLGDAASALVEASARADLPDGALLLIDHLNNTPKSPRPSASSCGHLMAKLLSLGRRADARRVFETIDDRKRSLAIITVWRAGRAADAVKVFGEMAVTAAVQKHSSSRYLIKNMMNDCLKKGDLEAASGLQTWMVQAGKKLPTRQRQMLRMLDEARARPDNIKWAHLIQISIMADSIDDAIRWLQQMGQDCMACPSATKKITFVHSYSQVLSVLWKVCRGDDAVKMFGDMADMSLAPNNFTYFVMINGHLKRLSHVLSSKKNESGDLEAAFQLRARMVQEGFKPEEYTYHLLMAELCLAERLGDVTALFHEMLMQGTTLHKIVHGSLFEFLFRIDQLLGIIKESAKDGVAAADNGCITLLKELCKIQKVSLAEKVLQAFAEAGLVPTTEMYNILIDGYCKINELQGTLSRRRQMKSHDQVLPNEATYDALLLGIIEKSTKEDVGAVDNITLLKLLCRIQKVSLAEKVLQTFAKAGLVPTTKMYDIVIDGYCKIGGLQGAFSLCRQMKSHGQVLPNEATYDALLLAVRNNTSITYWEDVVELFEKNGVSADALNSGSSAATYGFK